MRPHPWAGLCSTLGDPLASAASYVPGAGTGRAGSDMPSGCTRAAEFPQLLQRAKYFITLFSSRVASREPPSQPVGLRGKPARVSTARSPGVLSLVSSRSKAYATRCASMRLAARLLSHPCSSPINILNLQTNFRVALKKGRGLKSYYVPSIFATKQQNKPMQYCESRLQCELNPLLATRESTSHNSWGPLAPCHSACACWR